MGKVLRQDFSKWRGFIEGAYLVIMLGAAETAPNTVHLAAFQRAETDQLLLLLIP